MLCSEMQTNSNPEMLIECDRIFFFERHRTIDEHPLGIEKFYFHEMFESQIEGYNLEKSIGKLMLEVLKLPVEKMLQEVTVVKSGEEESRRLHLALGSDLMFMKRWIYIKGVKGVYQYYEFKVPVGVSAFPSEML